MFNIMLCQACGSRGKNCVPSAPTYRASLLRGSTIHDYYTMRRVANSMRLCTQNLCGLDVTGRQLNHPSSVPNTRQRFLIYSLVH